MQIYEKILSDTDSIYCAKPTNSHQSSIFIGQTNGEIPCGLFGADYVSDMDIIVELSRDNLLLNIMHHYLECKKYKKRGGNIDWNLDKNWLLEKELTVGKVFKNPVERFHVSINKETTRTYLKGIAGVKAEEGNEKIDIRNYLFSGDILHMWRKENGVIVITVAGRGGEDVLLNDVMSKSCLTDVDRLSVALKLFAEKRKDDGEGGWFDTGFDVNANIRGYFDALTVDVLKGFGEEKITELFCGLKGSDGKTFEPMWSGKPGMGWGHIKPNDPEAVQKIVDFLVLLKSDASVSARFLDKDFVRPAGFGRSVISELLMKFHPDTCLKHGERSHIALAWLGLIDFDWRNDYSDAEYKQVCGAAAKILQKMQSMKIPRLVNADGSEDTSKPDYLTVNEFIYFVNTNQDLIKEKIMGNAMKKDKPQKHKGEKALEWKKGSKDDELLLRLLASLRAKPFAILAGHSGTGKSRYVKKLAYMTCNAEELRNEKQLPGNYLLLQVKPNWHDSTDLLGYRNAITEGKYQPTELIKFIFRAYQFSETPFFLCLDEMNLAPVEQYFAEFLSAMESKEPVPLNDISEKEGNLFELGCEWEDSLEYLKEHGFSIPKNLFIVGTVNMDETTNQFSRKVLDRAFTIEMTDVDFANYGNVTEPSYDDTIKEETIEQLLAGEKLVKELDEEDKKEDSSLIKVQKALAATPFAIAYRFANEYTLLKRAIETFDPQGTMTLDALDQAVLMKILPRIAGERDYIEKVYGDKETVGLRSALVGKTVSLDKINEILERAKNTNANYITFWP